MAQPEQQKSEDGMTPSKVIDELFGEIDETDEFSLFDLRIDGDAGVLVPQNKKLRTYLALVFVRVRMSEFQITINTRCCRV